MTASVYTVSDSSLVAKVERKTAESSLLHELKVYSRLSNLSCVPKVYFFGEESGYYCLVLENVGKSIDFSSENGNHAECRFDRSCCCCGYQNGETLQRFGT
jgi:hypothetical protein